MIVEAQSRWVTIGGLRIFINGDDEASIPAYFKSQRAKAKYEKHAREFDDLVPGMTLEQFKTRAVELAGKTEGVDKMKLSDGKNYTYNAKTNEFVLVENNRITTFFRPADKQEYWKRKQEQYKELIV